MNMLTKKIQTSYKDARDHVDLCKRVRDMGIKRENFTDEQVKEITADDIDRAINEVGKDADAATITAKVIEMHEAKANAK